MESKKNPENMTKGFSSKVAGKFYLKVDLHRSTFTNSLEQARFALAKFHKSFTGQPVLANLHRSTCTVALADLHVAWTMKSHT